MTSERGNDACLAGPPLTERRAEEHVHGICFKTGPPGRSASSWNGWSATAATRLSRSTSSGSPGPRPTGPPGALPGRGRLTTEPGGQIELSSAPASGLGGCVTAARSDLAAVRQAMPAPAGLSLAGMASTPSARHGGCSITALRGHGGLLRPRRPVGPRDDVQHRVGAGLSGRGRDGDRADGLAGRVAAGCTGSGPVLVAAFANSPLCSGRPTGWSPPGRQVWATARPGPHPSPARRPDAAGNGRPTRRPARWADYALDAEVLCVRRPAATAAWAAPAGLTFRDWLRGAAHAPRRPATTWTTT